MNDEPSPDKDKSEPIRNATGADKRHAESQPNNSTAPPIAESVNRKTQQPNSANSEEETDRKQDQSIALLADQTEWISKQTKWIKYQVVASSFLGAVTLGVLLYHGWIMRRQSLAMADQTAIMKGQLDSMNSGSSQTQQMITAMQKQADASAAQAATSQALADQNKDLITATLHQAEAATRSAQIAQQSFYIGDMPYLHATAVLDRFEVGVKPNIVVTIENLGKTPALDFQLAAMVSVSNTPKPDLTHMDSPVRLAENLQQLPYAALVATEDPRTFLAAGAKLRGEIRGPEPTASLINDIKQFRQYIFVWGAGNYKDGLGRHHRLYFCFFYNTDDGFVACPTFNGTDLAKRELTQSQNLHVDH